MSVANLIDVTAQALQTSAPVVEKPVNAQQYTITKTFIAAEIGANANQVRHANGCLVAQLQGVSKVLSYTFEIHRNLNGFSQKVENIFTENGRAIPTLSVSANGLVKLRDQGTHADGYLVADDKLVITINIGN